MKPYMNNKGMTLLEIVVAMIIFSVGLLSLGMFIPYSTKKITNASARTTSVTMVQRLIDEVSSKSFDQLDSYNGVTLNPVPGSKHYRADMVVKYCLADGDTATTLKTSYKRIFITVTPLGGGESVTMSTVMSKKG